MMKSIQHQVVLVDKKSWNDQQALLIFKAPIIAKHALPGQFINLACSKLLKRPFGICDVNLSEGLLSIGVQKVGKGSEDILNFPLGSTHEMIGPLGKGFDFHFQKKIILVGGGTGIFPLYFAAQTAKKLQIPVTFILGFRDEASSFFLEECKQVGDKTIFTSDQGGLDLKGNVIDALESLQPADYQDATIFTVGPEIMMQRVAEWGATKQLPCQVSLEKRMACGVGICLVCTCKIKPNVPAPESMASPLHENTRILTTQPLEQEKFHHLRCCTEGPVFNSQEVVW